MDNNPLVAIVIPVYNREKYIGECIDHIIAQTYTNWICYITDNNSSDNTIEVMQRHIGSDSRFKIFKNDATVPLVQNLNIAYSHIGDTSAKYSKLEPSDDWMFPEYIEQMVNILERDDDVGGCFSYRLNNTLVDCDGLNIYDGNIFDGKKILFDQLTGKNIISGSLGTPLYRVDALRKISPLLKIYNEENYHADTELAHDIMANFKIGFVFQVLSYIRRHALTESSFCVKNNTYFNAIEQCLCKRLTIFPELTSHYRRFRLQYAWFFLKMTLQRNRECIQWHKTYLRRPFTLTEFIISPIYVLLSKIWHIIRNIFK